MSDTLVQGVALSRRSFLVTAGGATIGVAFGVSSGDGAAQTMGTMFKPNAWVTIAPSGTITIVSAGSEMGQGTMTAMPLLVAEEMDADWKKVRVVQAPADAKSYGNPLFGGAQTTGASRTTRGYYDVLRKTGIQTRRVLLASAAEQWNVTVGELTTEPSMVVHAKSGRKISYGELAKTAKVPAQMAEVTPADYKPLAQCRYIGKDIPRVDVPSKVNGTAKYGIDTQLPNMLYGAVLRAPVQGEKPDRIDDAAAKAVKGVVQIVPLPYGVGVIGRTVESTKKAKEALKVTWSNSAKARSYDSAKVLEDYRAVSRDLGTAGVDVLKHGDPEAAIKGAAKVVAVDYVSDHVAHACMEPMNATAIVRGDTIEVWSPNQSPTLAQAFSARMGGTTPDKVAIHTTLLGGGFGRRIEPDFTIDAVMLAKAVPGRPVKVIWSREDDIQNDKYRPLVAQHFRVGLDAAGNVTGWHHRLVGESIYARAAPPIFQAGGGKDPPFHEGAEVNYEFPAHHVEFLREQRGVDVGFWRAVGPGYTKFGVEALLDELAAMKGVDPVAYRLDLLKDEPRARNVIQTVARMADWGRKREGRGLGIAYSDAWGAHCAQVAEVSLNRQTGEIRVHNVWCAVDAGVSILPQNVIAQIESAVIYGVSHALYEQINFKNGEVQESNFHDYRVMRMSEAPVIQVGVIQTDNQPSGMGEVGLPPVGPAIANAVAQITGGVRLRHYPLLPSRVKQALGTA
jgi:isoquinoline 1-oxidoreductase beta subunit